MQRAVLAAALVTIVLLVIAIAAGGTMWWILFGIALAATVFSGMYLVVGGILSATTKRNPKY